MINSIIVVDPSKRPNMQQILSHPSIQRHIHTLPGYKQAVDAAHQAAQNAGMNGKDIIALKNPPTQSFISQASQYIVKFISTALYSQNNLENQQKKTEIQFPKINNFFCYLRQFANLTGSEIIYTTFLDQKLIESEKQDSDEDKDRIIINDMNIGTVLICAGILAMNMMQNVVKCKNYCFLGGGDGVASDVSESEVSFFLRLFRLFGGCCIT
ncbi:MAG: hypothetical protein EZS28_044391, partial [Streblomastix strix]